MKDILLEGNLKILEGCSSLNTVYGFDFDGTLAPIVENPVNARMTEVTSALLKELNDIASVAIITGRSVKDVQPLLPFTPKYLIGNHGIEGMLDPSDLKEIEVLIDNLKKTLLSELRDELIEHGIYVEDKIYSLTLHYRNSLCTQNTINVLEKFFQSHPTTRVVKGKMVLNVLPNSNDCKGSAFLKILKFENAKFGLYIGDDYTDEDVFSRRDPRIIGIKVGTIGSSQAPYFIKRQTDINVLLEILIKSIKASQGRGF